MRNGKRMLAAVCIVLTVVLCMTACGGSADALKGTWSGTTADLGDVTWTFDGKGGCSMKTAAMEDKGTYKIDGSNVAIQLELWDSAVTFAFTTDGKTLSLKDTAGLATDYENLTKK